MVRAVNLHIGAQHRMIADMDRCGIKDHAPDIQKHITPQMDIDAIGTMKPRFDPHIIGTGRKQGTQGRPDIAAFCRGQHAMLVTGFKRTTAQGRKLRIKAAIPFPCLHFLKFGFGHFRSHFVGSIGRFVCGLPSLACQSPGAMYLVQTNKPTPRTRNVQSPNRGSQDV